MVQIWAFTALIVRFKPLEISVVNKIIEGYSMGISFLLRTFLGGFYGNSTRKEISCQTS
jgi:hypothetical protein